MHTPKGTVQARRVLLAGNGYLAGLNADVQAHVMPLHNYIVTTEPLGRSGAEALIRNRLAVSDSRFVVYTSGLRPMSGCCSGVGRPIPAGSRATSGRWCVRTCCGSFRSWRRCDSNTPGAARWRSAPTRLPYVRELATGLYNASGFSGLGVVLAPFTGKVMAEALLGDEAALRLLAALPVPAFPGGALLRRPAVDCSLELVRAAGSILKRWHGGQRLPEL